ncbi:hypothetical protein CXG81DRAFT_25223 [Caulochytrium protostelioides]|uniref:Rho-GAP domain-containing protein n=1 Tax=Caulochytrium protostelioides TaxID=1555241 RepID=A0A4P9X9X3_9FUNG|nr:hypothetical protein CXG81DRAFT_25223 [Caulochytrium protostelioides]|eukprot:RKP02138.1 hypothetical protein CXG81DRAFT_25223 [Caulochytrium protostelioides]
MAAATTAPPPCPAASVAASVAAGMDDTTARRASPLPLPLPPPAAAPSAPARPLSLVQHAGPPLADAIKRASLPNAAALAALPSPASSLGASPDASPHAAPVHRDGVPTAAVAAAAAAAWPLLSPVSPLALPPAAAAAISAATDPDAHVTGGAVGAAHDDDTSADGRPTASRAATAGPTPPAAAVSSSPEARARAAAAWISAPPSAPPSTSPSTVSRGSRVASAATAAAPASPPPPPPPAAAPLPDAPALPTATRSGTPPPPVAVAARVALSPMAIPARSASLGWDSRAARLARLPLRQAGALTARKLHPGLPAAELDAGVDLAAHVHEAACCCWIELRATYLVLYTWDRPEAPEGPVVDGAWVTAEDDTHSDVAQVGIHHPVADAGEASRVAREGGPVAAPEAGMAPDSASPGAPADRPSARAAAGPWTRSSPPMLRSLSPASSSVTAAATANSTLRSTLVSEEPFAALRRTPSPSHPPSHAADRGAGSTGSSPLSRRPPAPVTRLPIAQSMPSTAAAAAVSDLEDAAVGRPPDHQTPRRPRGPVQRPSMTSLSSLSFNGWWPRPERDHGSDRGSDAAPWALHRTASHDSASSLATLASSQSSATPPPAVPVGTARRVLSAGRHVQAPPGLRLLQALNLADAAVSLVEIQRPTTTRGPGSGAASRRLRRHGRPHRDSRSGPPDRAPRPRRGLLIRTPRHARPFLLTPCEGADAVPSDAPAAFTAALAAGAVALDVWEDALRRSINLAVMAALDHVLSLDLLPLPAFAAATPTVAAAPAARAALDAPSPAKAARARGKSVSMAIDMGTVSASESSSDVDECADASAAIRDRGAAAAAGVASTKSARTSGALPRRRSTLKLSFTSRSIRRRLSGHVPSLSFKSVAATEAPVADPATAAAATSTAPATTLSSATPSKDFRHAVTGNLSALWHQATTALRAPPPSLASPASPPAPAGAQAQPLAPRPTRTCSSMSVLPPIRTCSRGPSTMPTANSPTAASMTPAPSPSSPSPSSPSEPLVIGAPHASVHVGTMLPSMPSPMARKPTMTSLPPDEATRVASQHPHDDVDAVAASPAAGGMPTRVLSLSAFHGATPHHTFCLASGSPLSTPSTPASEADAMPAPKQLEVAPATSSTKPCLQLPASPGREDLPPLSSPGVPETTAAVAAPLSPSLSPTSPSPAPSPSKGRRGAGATRKTRGKFATPLASLQGLVASSPLSASAQRHDPESLVANEAVLAAAGADSPAVPSAPRTFGSRLAKMAHAARQIGTHVTATAAAAASLSSSSSSPAGKSMAGNPRAADAAERAAQLDAHGVPYALRACIAALAERGFGHEGLYRVSGSSACIARLTTYLRRHAGRPDPQAGLGARLLHGALDPERYDHDIHVLAGTIKALVRAPHPSSGMPLAPPQSYALFMAVYRHASETSDLCLPTIRAAVHAMPDAHQATLQTLCEHLAAVAALSHENRMTPRNLGIVFGPTVFAPPPSPPPPTTSTPSTAPGAFTPSESGYLAGSMQAHVTVVELLVTHAADIFAPGPPPSPPWPPSPSSPPPVTAMGQTAAAGKQDASPPVASAAEGTFGAEGVMTSSPTVSTATDSTAGAVVAMSPTIMPVATAGATAAAAETVVVRPRVPLRTSSSLNGGGGSPAPTGLPLLVIPPRRATLPSDPLGPVLPTVVALASSPPPTPPCSKPAPPAPPAGPDPAALAIGA